MKIDKTEALNIIRRNLREGSYIISKHIREKFIKTNCDIHDVLHIIYNPTSVNDPEYDETHNNWKVEITGIAIDGYELNIILGIWEDEVQLITVW